MLVEQFSLTTFLYYSPHLFYNILVIYDFNAGVNHHWYLFNLIHSCHLPFLPLSQYFVYKKNTIVYLLYYKNINLCEKVVFKE
jgi:hypothetical protein